MQEVTATNTGLPALRGDLKLLPGPPDRQGQPSWTVHDPARNRYFQLGAAAVEMLRRWHLGDASRILADIQAETVLRPQEKDFKALIQFLTANQLLARSDGEAVEALCRIAAARRRGWLSWLLHNYLFMRIPLIRPDRFLAATQPIADAVASVWAERLILLLGVVGLFLASRQWDGFLATFAGFLNPQGAVWIAAVLFATKLLHELGHGYTARRLGCHVPSMGVALLVLYPVLYTDTTDAYRLTDRRARLRIGSAGVRVELALALLATFLWSFLPEGPARSAVFLVASVTWVSTLLINLNPFMRFDGYYLLADAWNMPNLQPRAFALARWHLREWLFGFGEAPPEPFDPAMRRRLIFYAHATWIYRLVLFLGIALLVYHLFFKVLGLILFAVEILWFVLLPIWREFGEWYRRRAAIRPNFGLVLSSGLVCLVLAGMAWPWNARISAPAIWSARGAAPLVTGLAGQVEVLRLAPGQLVQAGEEVLRLHQPELTLLEAANRIERAVIQLELARAQTDTGAAASLPALLAQEARLAAQRSSIAATGERLRLRAPFAGRIADIQPDLAPGQWLPAGEVLGRVLTPDGVIRVLVAEGELSRLRMGAEARFLPEDALARAISGRVTHIAPAAILDLPNLLFAAQHGGDIAADSDVQGRMKPRSAYYLVEIEPEDGRAPDHLRRGTARIEGPPVSLFEKIWRAIAVVLVRESGF